MIEMNARVLMVCVDFQKSDDRTDRDTYASANVGDEWNCGIETARQQGVTDRYVWEYFGLVLINVLRVRVSADK